jgi:hypothetical protein
MVTQCIFLGEEVSGFEGGFAYTAFTTSRDVPVQGASTLPLLCVFGPLQVVAIHASLAFFGLFCCRRGLDMRRAYLGFWRR